MSGNRVPIKEAEKRSLILRNSSSFIDESIMYRHCQPVAVAGPGWLPDRPIAVASSDAGRSQQGIVGQCLD